MRKPTHLTCTEIMMQISCIFKDKVGVYCHKIDCLLQLSLSIIGAWASLIRLMLLRDNVISRLVFIATQVIL